MTVSAALYGELQAYLATNPRYDGADLCALETAGQILGYAITCARAKGEDEADEAELICRAAGMSPSTVRQHERTLRKLGYIKAADRLRQIAGRRKHDLAPLD